MKTLKNFFDWLDTKQADVIFGAFFFLFLIKDLFRGNLWLALLDAIMLILNVISFKRKG